MSDHVELRPVRPDDLTFILELEADPGIAPFIRPWPAAHHIKAQSNPNLTYLIACHDAEKVGFVILRTQDDHPDKVEFVRLAIGRRGIGLGKGTVHTVKRHVKDAMSAQTIWLEVFPQNPRAMGLYTALGFVQIDVRDTDLGFDGKPGQVIRMQLALR